MSDHTPGPWVARPNEYSYRGWDIVADGVIVARCKGPEAEANARMIAGVLELVGSCQGLLRHCPCDPDIHATWYKAWRRAERAIAKAGGDYGG